MTTSDIQTLMRVGGSVSVDASKTTSSDIQTLAKLANTHGVSLTVRNASTKSTSDLLTIARLAPGKVIFEL